MKRMNMKSLSFALTVLLMAGSLPGCGESAVQNSPDETVKIEAMSAYSTNTVVPAYVDVSLQTKVARDEESGEMMQIVMDGRVMDFGYLYCGWNGWTWQLANLFKDPGTYASNLQKNIKMMTKTYENIMKKFMD